MLRILILLLALTGPAYGEEVVAGLSQNRVAITANFDGSEILIFGAVKRDAPTPVTGEMHVIVTVAGPSKPVTVRRKEHRYGIWMNTDSVIVDSAPSFYSVATSASLNDILLETEDLRHKISIPRAIRSVGVPDDVSDAASFTEALIRIKTKKDLYQLKPEAVVLDEETLFKTQIALPANLTEGAYITRIFLTRNGKVVDTYETTIAVQKVGLERWLFNLAHERPLIYGLLSLFIAIVAGWGASAVFRYLRP